MPKAPTVNISLLVLCFDSSGSMSSLGTTTDTPRGNQGSAVSAAGEDTSLNARVSDPSLERIRWHQEMTTKTSFHGPTVAPPESNDTYQIHSLMTRIWHQTDLLVPIAVFHLSSLSVPSWTKKGAYSPLNKAIDSVHPLIFLLLCLLFTSVIRSSLTKMATLSRASRHNSRY